MEQNLLKEGKLLNEDGTLTEAGYAFSRVKHYNPEVIKKKNRLQLKEWNYYAFLNDENGIAITISYLTYSALLSITYFDFKLNKYLTKTYTKLFPKKKKFDLPKNDGNKILIKEKKYVFDVTINKGYANIYFNVQDFADGNSISANLKVKETNDKSIVTTIPFPKKGQFYYNQKVNLLVAEGNITIGSKTVNLKESYGVLDWGRGVWPYRTTWYWSSCNVKNNNGDLLGFNLGYGLGDTSKGSENMVFFNDEAYKLDDVEFIFKTNSKGVIDYMGDIEVVSKDRAIDLVFTPLFNRHDHINLAIISSNQNQVFGKFNGTIKANGKTFEFKDAIGFLEKVINRY